jgi:hypothetical protein
MIQGAIGFKELRRGVFGLFLPHRHGAQAIFLEGEFAQRFKCAHAVDAHCKCPLLTQCGH